MFFLVYHMGYECRKLCKKKKCFRNAGIFPKQKELKAVQAKKNRTNCFAVKKRLRKL